MMPPISVTAVMLRRWARLNGVSRNMTSVTEMGGIIYPPLPAFYHRPTSIDELVDDTVERVLALLGTAGAQPLAWAGLR